MTKQTGGEAFPRVVGYSTMAEGMTLRDYFAAKALQGMLADLPKTLYGIDWESNVTKSAYSIADAMLKARK